MGIWEKLGLGKKEEKTAEPSQKAALSSQEEGLARAMAHQVGDQRLQQLQAASSQETPIATSSKQEGRASKNVEGYLADVLPGAKEGVAKALNDLRSFTGDDTRAKLLDRWKNLVIPPGGGKKPFVDWLSDKREEIIQKLGQAEDYQAVVQHMDEAFREAGKDPEKAMELLERNVAEINRRITEMKRGGATDSQVAALQLQSARLCKAINKIDDLVQKA